MFLGERRFGSMMNVRVYFRYSETVKVAYVFVFQIQYVKFFATVVIIQHFKNWFSRQQNNPRLKWNGFLSLKREVDNPFFWCTSSANFCGEIKFPSAVSRLTTFFLKIEEKITSLFTLTSCSITL